MDTSESRRIVRFRERMILPTESASERAARSIHDAIDDLNAAVWIAPAPDDVLQIRALAEEAIARLIDTSSVALTLAEHFGETR